MLHFKDKWTDAWPRSLPCGPWLAEGVGPRGHLLWRRSDGWVPLLGQQGCVDGDVVLSLLKRPSRNRILKGMTFNWHGWSKAIPSARYPNTHTSTSCGWQPEQRASCLVKPVRRCWARQGLRPAFLRCNDGFINGFTCACFWSDFWSTCAHFWSD